MRYGTVRPSHGSAAARISAATETHAAANRNARERACMRLVTIVIDELLARVLVRLVYAHEDAGCALPRRLRDRRHIQCALPGVALLAGRRDLAIGFVVDDGPAAALLEREVDDAFDERAVGKSACDRRLAATGAARVGGARATEELVSQQSLHHHRRGARPLL